MKIYNLSVIDRDGRALEFKGVTGDQVSTMKARLMAIAVGKGFKPPIAFYKQEVRTR